LDFDIGNDFDDEESGKHQLAPHSVVSPEKKATSEDLVKQMLMNPLHGGSLVPPQSDPRILSV
jgi:hypothetical protein